MARWEAIKVGKTWRVRKPNGNGTSTYVMRPNSPKHAMVFMTHEGAWKAAQIRNERNKAAARKQGANHD